jgi:hypothetical protein
MSGSFWAGAVPPWALAFGTCLLALCTLLGIWAGIGWERALEAREEDEELAEVQAATRKRCPELEPGTVHMYQRADGSIVPAASVAPEVAHEAWLAHTEQAMDLANDDPTVSAWTQEMAQSMDAWLAEHVYSVPIPYLPGDEQR